MVELTAEVKNNFIPEKIRELPQFASTYKNCQPGVNSHYFTKNGKPIFPVMGEFHYTRYPREYWEEAILKTRAGGLQIVASYVFWIHHQEIEGQFDWSGRRNLRQFIKLCDRHEIPLVLRIGPWAHGECRNGGFPDWFYNGRIWRIGLRRFKDRLPEAEIKLKIEALTEKDDIYLERKPRFREGRACELLSVGLEPEYSCRITVQ
ncbi:MAG: beta-galactosidase [Bacillota bacterium]